MLNTLRPTIHGKLLEQGVRFLEFSFRHTLGTGLNILKTLLDNVTVVIIYLSRLVLKSQRKNALRRVPVFGTVRMNTSNFLSARMLRQNIVKSLQEQQCHDSTCSEQLRLVISRHTRTILTLVSELLLSFTDASITDEDRSLFLNLTRSSLTADSWLKSRAQENNAAVELLRLKTLVNSAEAEYSRIAPLGRVMTGWISSPQEKSQINTAKASLERLRREYEKAESNHETKLATFHQNAEHFLRNAMSPEGLSALVEKSSVRANLKNALDAMNEEISKLWFNHTKAQNESLENLQSATTKLVAMYRADHTTTKAALLGS